MDDNTAEVAVDLVGDALKAEARAWSMETLANFKVNLEIDLNPAWYSAADLVHDPVSGEAVGWTRYWISFSGTCGYSKGVVYNHQTGRVTILFKANVGGSYSILRMSPGMVFSEMSKSLTSPQLSRQEELEEQKKWWTSNEKTFSLLQLPPEVRDLVYEFALGPIIKPYPTHWSRNVHPRGLEPTPDQVPNINLLYANQQVYKEGSAVMARSSSFLLETRAIALELIADKQQISRVGRLVFALPLDHYLRIFPKLEWWGEGPDKHKQSIDLRDLNLNSLEFKIAAPTSLVGPDFLDSLCHAKVLTTLLEAFWDKGKGHPVSVTGYILPGLKARFETKCAKERAKFLEWKSFIEAERSPEQNTVKKSSLKRTKRPALTQKKMSKAKREQMRDLKIIKDTERCEQEYSGPITLNTYYEASQKNDETLQALGEIDHVDHAATAEFEHTTLTFDDFPLLCRCSRLCTKENWDAMLQRKVTEGEYN